MCVLSRWHGSNSCQTLLSFPISSESWSPKKASLPCSRSQSKAVWENGVSTHPKRAGLCSLPPNRSSLGTGVMGPRQECLPWGVCGGTSAQHHTCWSWIWLCWYMQLHLASTELRFGRESKRRIGLGAPTGCCNVKERQYKTYMNPAWAGVKDRARCIAAHYGWRTEKGVPGTRKYLEDIKQEGLQKTIP